jgi:hypothetical protein
MRKIPDAIRHIGYFDKKDYGEFQKFLESPYLNNVKALSVIFKVIWLNKKLLIPSKYDELEKQITGTTDYSKGTIKKLLSYLNKAVLKYYGIKDTLKDDLYVQLKLAESLLYIRDFKTLNIHQEFLSDKIFKLDKIEEMSFYYSYLLNTNLFLTSFSGNDYWKKNNTGTEDFINNSSTDIYFYTLIILVCDYMNFVLRNVDFKQEKLIWENINLDYIFKAGSEMMKKETNEFRIVTYNLYYKLYLTFKHFKEDKYYEDYKSYFLENSGIYKKDTVRNHFIMLTSYCIIRERTSDENNYFKRESTALQNLMIEKDYLKSPHDKYLHSVHFRNYIITDISTQDPDVLLSFIKNNSNKLSPKEQDNMLNFGMAHYHYLKKEYQKALKCLNDIKLNYFFYKYDILNLEFKIYYETKNIEPIERTIHNYKQMIKTDSFLTKYDKKRLTSFLEYYQRFIFLTFKRRNRKNFVKDISYFRDQIINEKTFAMKRWLISKANELLVIHPKKPSLEN